MERSLQAGASVAAIAQEHGINANLLFNWRPLRVLCAVCCVRKPNSELESGPIRPPVTVQAESTVVVSKPLPTPRASRGVMEIDIGAERVRSRGAVDEASVRCALQLLGATRDRTEVLNEIAGEGAGINRKRLRQV
ncbi:transposase [Variovorax sp. LjRoot84]|uniref:transposase n=1 Tax=Variovorax sp. LjRoot84 TaxID=3342340 RepID=UPI003F51226C